MSKESATWLVIRIIGLFLLGEALLFFFDAAAQLVTLWKLSGIDGSLATKAEHQIVRSSVEAGTIFIQAVVVGAFSYYFLHHGRAVHGWLMRESS